MLLEKALLQRLHDLAGGEAAEAVGKLVADTADSLDMEALASKDLLGFAQALAPILGDFLP